MFREARFHCTTSKGSGKSRHCVEYAENSLVETVWTLGWQSSVATIVLPIALWYGLVNLNYPLWLALGRPRRN